MVRRPPGAYRLDSKYKVKSEGCSGCGGVVCGFSGEKRTDGLYFLT